MRRSIKNRIADVLIQLILLALLNLIVFAVMKPWRLEAAYRLVFWFSYGALMLAFCLRFVSFALDRRNTRENHPQVSLPLTFTVLLYYGATLLLSVLYMILSVASVAIPFACPLVTLVILLGFYLIAVIRFFANASAPRNEAQNEALMAIAQDVRALVAAAPDAILAKKLEQLAENLATASLAAERVAALSPHLEELKRQVTAADTLGASRAIAALRAYLAD